MKKLLVLGMMVLATMSFAQTKETTASTSKENAVFATRSGMSFVGANTSGLGFETVDKVTQTRLGLDAGVFAVDNLAIVGSVGYQAVTSEFYNANAWTYGIGAKYFILSQFPLQVDYNGAVGNGYNPSASYVGVQLGYAWFPWRNVSLEPRVKQDFSLDRAEYSNRFSGAVGINLHF